jgi:hypothetical protein
VGEPLTSVPAGATALELTAGARSQGLTGGGAGAVPVKTTPAMPEVTRPAKAPNAWYPAFQALMYAPSTPGHPPMSRSSTSADFSPHGSISRLCSFDTLLPVIRGWIAESAGVQSAA